MKKIFFVVALVATSSFLSCESNEVEAPQVNVVEKFTQDKTTQFMTTLGGIRAKSQTRSHTGEITDEIVAEVMLASKAYLAKMEIDYSEFFSEDDDRIITLAAAVAEYVQQQEVRTSRGTLYSCAIQAIGASELAKGLTKQAIQKAALKLAAKTASKLIPGVGWGVFGVELVWCLLD